jgi:hypothetical protein
MGTFPWLSASPGLRQSSWWGDRPCLTPAEVKTSSLSLSFFACWIERSLGPGSLREGHRVGPAAVTSCVLLPSPPFFLPGTCSQVERPRRCHCPHSSADGPDPACVGTAGPRASKSYKLGSRCHASCTCPSTRRLLGLSNSRAMPVSRASLRSAWQIHGAGLPVGSGNFCQRKGALKVTLAGLDRLQTPTAHLG